MLGFQACVTMPGYLVIHFFNTLKEPLNFLMVTGVPRKSWGPQEEHTRHRETVTRQHLEKTFGVPHPEGEISCPKGTAGSQLGWGVVFYDFEPSGSPCSVCVPCQDASALNSHHLPFCPSSLSPTRASLCFLETSIIGSCPEPSWGTR